jgi:FkbM family methyltransferase
MSSTAKKVYARFQMLTARKAFQPGFRVLRSIAASGMNYQPGHFTTSGELAVLERIRASGTPVDTIVDVGANIGEWSLAATEIFPEATVYSFEPASDTFEELERRLRGRRVIAVHGALSDMSGTRTLRSVPGMSWMSSLEELDLTRLNVEASETEDVPCFTLDEFCATHGLDSIDILKIDTEGHELAVLHGARGLLDTASVGYIQFELGAANLDTRTFLKDFVTLLGSRYRIFRILRDGLHLLTYSAKEESFSEANFYAVATGRPVP